MKMILLLLLVASAILAQTSDSITANDLIIQQIIQDQKDGWNNGDAKQYARSFQEEGIFTIITGATFYNRSSLEKRVAFILSGFFKNTILTQKIIKINYVSNYLAIVEIETEMTNYKGLPPGVKASADQKLKTSMLQVLMKTNDEWKVIAFHNVDVKVP